VVCSRHCIALHGVPVVGRLQARWERRRGLQVLGGVIVTSSDVVGELMSVYVLFPIGCSMSDVPCGEGVHLPFIDQGGGELQACRTV
jgi:hypothetical protein